MASRFYPYVVVYFPAVATEDPRVLSKHLTLAAAQRALRARYPSEQEVIIMRQSKLISPHSGKVIYLSSTGQVLW